MNDESQKPVTKAYRDNWDRIFNKATAEADSGQRDTEVVALSFDCGIHGCPYCAKVQK